MTPLRLTRLLQIATLVVVSSAISAMLGELLLRALGHHGVPYADLSKQIRHVDDPILDFRYIPNSVVWNGSIAYRYNSAGFRDVEHPVANPRGVPRIAVVGDSVSEGYGVSFDDVFAANLQRRLGSAAEVINIAMSGLNTPQEVHLLEVNGLEYHPDVVVLNFVLNDCDFYTLYKPALEYQRKKDGELDFAGISIPPGLKRWLKSSALIYFVKERAERSLASEDRSDYVASIWSKPENRKKVSDGFEKLSRLRKQHRFEAVVLVWPVLVNFRAYPYDEIHRWVVDQAESVGIPVIDLRPAFAEHGDYTWFFITANDAYHPNAAGHDVGAAAFESWYRRRASVSD